MLAPADTRLAMDAALRLMDVVTLDDFPERALEVVAMLVPGDSFSYTEIDPVAQRHVSVIEPDEYTQDEFEAFAKYALQNPLVSHYFATGDGAAHYISEFITLEEFRKTQLWQRAYGPMGVNYQIAMSLPAELPLVIGIVVNRGKSDFTERDCEILDLTRPHFAQAQRNASLFHALDVGRSVLNDMVEEEGRSVALVHPSGRLEILGAGFAETLGRFFGERSGLPLDVAQWLRAQRAAARDVACGLATARPFELAVDGRVVRLTASLGARSDLPDVLVLTERSLAPDLSPLRELGLTGRESEVAQMVAAGNSNHEIGEALSISSATAKKHVERVFQKLEVTSRVAVSLAVREHIEI